jgi:tetratricopeptide (TPR) repeat protein
LEVSLTRQDDKTRLRNRLIEQAISEAANNQWDTAAELNQKALELGEDPETYNRLGKAFNESNRYREAIEAYQNTIRIAPSNVIARRNIAKLEPLIHADAKSSIRSRELVDLRLFISETGKTGITALTNTDATVGARLSSGERVELRQEGRLLNVYTSDGVLIGRVEPKLAQRITELMAGGNKYAAAVAHADGGQIRVVIRETVQHPSLRKKISFPGKLSGDMGSFRPYVRDYTLRYDFESDDEDIDEDTDEDDDEDDIDEVSLDDVEGEEEAEEDDLGS